MQRITDYRAALTYIYSFTDYEKRGFAVYAPEFYNLDRVHRLLGLLGDPQQNFQTVHIAGTKGKGSTAAMVESVLRAAGYRTALYTSPHLHSFRERIQVGGSLIPEASVAPLVEQMRPYVSLVDGLTTFEIMTAMALLWFSGQGVEWAVLEVGLGGRLDATNVVVPAVSVITSISLDHTAILGNSLALIAAEKAAIAKSGVPVVSAPQAAEALAVIEGVCERIGAPLILVGRDWSWQAGQASLQGQAFAVHHGPETLADLWLPLLGEHQLENATTAVATVSTLRQRGALIPPHTIRDGLRSVHWPGRFEVLGYAPLVIADSAHNADSARKLMATIKDYCQFRRLILILGVSGDHASLDTLEAFLAPADIAIATRSRHSRAADPAWLQAQAKELGYDLQETASVPEAVDLALASAGPEDLICGTGSVFVAAELRAAWFQLQDGPSPPADPV